MISRVARNPTSTSVSVGAKPGAMREISVVIVCISSASSMKWEKTTMMTAESGMRESITLCATAAVSSRPWLRRKKSRSTRLANRTIFGKRFSIRAQAWTRLDGLANAKPEGLIGSPDPYKFSVRSMRLRKSARSAGSSAEAISRARPETTSASMAPACSPASHWA